jgi:hypothetical protein
LPGANIQTVRVKGRRSEAMERAGFEAAETANLAEVGRFIVGGRVPWPGAAGKSKAGRVCRSIVHVHSLLAILGLKREG